MSDENETTFDEDTRARGEEPDPEPTKPAADEPDEDDAPPLTACEQDATAPMRTAEVQRIARNLLARAHERKTQLLLSELLERCEGEPECAELVDELRDQVAGELLGAALEGYELGAPWINLTKLGPLANLIPPEVTAGIDLLNAAKSGIDAISQPAQAHLQNMTAAANAGDPKAQAALQTVHQAVAIQKAQGATPDQGGRGHGRGPDAHPAADGPGGFSAYQNAMRWMRQ
jgi:hypothetical protein